MLLLCMLWHTILFSRMCNAEHENINLKSPKARKKVCRLKTSSSGEAAFHRRHRNACVQTHSFARPRVALFMHAGSMHGKRAHASMVTSRCVVSTLFAVFLPATREPLTFRLVRFVSKQGTFSDMLLESK